MKKDKNTSTGVSKTTAPRVAMGVPRMAQQREQRACAFPAPAVAPNWARYADSRLKQFCLR